MSQGLKLVLEAGPLLAFFVVNAKMGIIVATGVLIVLTLAALAVSYWKTRRVPTMPLVAGGMVLVFGGLTVLFEDETFIKIKPTVVYTLFAAAIFIGLGLGRNYLKTLMESALTLDDEGWRKLAIRWGLFFVVMAVVNEAVWRTQTTDMWVNFKVFGFLPITFIFAFAQLPLIMRHQVETEEPET
ncbi:MAG: septation protein A [Alphaproteobacteria bacterium]|nr:septation protein A [Alphaproteobacteria bacterium]